MKISRNRLSMSPEPAASLAARLLPFYGRGKRTQAGPVQGSSLCSEAAFNARNLPPALERLLTPQEGGFGLADMELAVQVGLTHSRLGLMRTSMAVAATDRDEYVRAWIRQMWSIDPASQITRWAKVGRDQDLLVSGVDRAVFECIDAFASRTGMRFVSCRPAALSMLEMHGSSATSNDQLFVWTEPAHNAPRTELVMLTHGRGDHLRAVWRGWIPASERDEALAGAVARFAAAHAITPDVAIHQVHWDDCPDASPVETVAV
ncbi:hypothetical protein [Ramlibacter tataouinensis]|uniref:hypothetical protein n=1 Tax=Ramlibacter tataouinensis TaxID=94132 RepID=UPI00117DDF61|nr:hypothetical protein [Ramlibacter tataouinensis]